jgi:crotonobetainyl-CoA:carnitine CoA-transferase CaiB-like acyl-CoA transferase
MEPFADVDVLDLTQSIAGPLSTQLLGALGANVVKVEPPGGDDFRSLLGGAVFAAYNIGKRSLALDLKTDAGREAARELAARADVVVESFRPGVMAGFGLDYDSVRRQNPEVVYCSVTGFGAEGPYSDRPAYDPVLQAMSGLLATTGYPDRPPVRIGASVVDCGTGMTAAFAVAGALAERDRTGESQRVEVSLFDVAVSWMGYWLAHYTATGETPSRARRGGFAGLAPNGVFEAGDGHQLYVSAANDRQFRRLCDALDRPDLAERFPTADDRWSQRGELMEALSAAFDDHDRDPLVAALVEAGVPAGPVRGVEELLEDAHVEARDLLTGTETADGERIRTAGVPFTAGGARPALGDRPPGLGEHTRAVLSELGYSEQQVEAMLAAGAAVD